MRLTERQVEDELVNLKVAVLLDDLDQVDVGVDRQAHSDSASCSCPLRWLHPHEQRTSRYDELDDGLG